MSVRSFGFNKDGEEVLLYTIANENIELSVSNYGATMVSLIEKSTGIDVLLGYDNVEGYTSHAGHLGGFIGRTANRIKDAKFTLNGETYNLEINSKTNNIHGGETGFDRVMYEAEETDNTVTFHRISKDGEAGYPGDLDVTVTYTLLENGVELKAEGKALNKDTLFAMTNHNYYNLDGSDSILTHKVTLHAQQYADDDPDGISVLPLKNVEGTAFDFRNGKELGQDIACDDPQIIQNNGYDHHWAIDGTGLREFAVCQGKQLEMRVCSNLPGMHMYTSNFLNGTGKGGKAHTPHTGVCFEPEFIPNAINYDGVVKPIVKCGETSTQLIQVYLKKI
ncbi:MAG: galactose mutarotase [Solobacterium sp.]|nr:galactose mutarotase [Solobacterium sp.]